LRVTLRLAGECRSILGANEELLARCIRPGRTATRTGNGLRTNERRCRHFGSQGSEADRAHEECTSGGVHDGSSMLFSDPYSTPLTRHVKRCLVYTMQQTRKSRGGRPWSFDRQEAIEKAMRLF